MMTMSEAKSFLDLMPKEERERAIEKANKRLSNQKQRKSLDVSPEMYLTSEFGYYYGWEAIKAIRNDEITLPEVQVLLEGARKVWYAKLIEQTQAGIVSNTFTTPAKGFDQATRQFAERAEVKN